MFTFRAFLLMGAIAVSTIIPGVYSGEAAVEYIYFAANPNRQIGGSPLENFVMESWFDGQPVLWYTADANVVPYIDQAIIEWQNHVPQLISFTQTSVQADAHLTFETGTEDDCGGGVGAWKPDAWTNDLTRQANYLRKATICLALGRVAEDHKVRVVEHEMGHAVMGLEERYDPDIVPGECNPDDTTIMDTMDLISNVFYHCDLGPWEWDGERAIGFVKEGQMLALDGNELVGGVSAPARFTEP